MAYRDIMEGIEDYHAKLKIKKKIKSCKKKPACRRKLTRLMKEKA